MTTPTPETPAGGLTTVCAEAFDEWLHRMHGITSSCRHEAEGAGIAEAVLASEWLADHVAAAVVQARAEDRARIQAVLALADELDEDTPARTNQMSAIAAMIRDRAALTATEDGDRP